MDNGRAFVEANRLPPDMRDDVGPGTDRGRPLTRDMTALTLATGTGPKTPPVLPQESRIASETWRASNWWMLLPMLPMRCATLIRLAINGVVLRPV